MRTNPILALSQLFAKRHVAKGNQRRAAAAARAAAEREAAEAAAKGLTEEEKQELAVLRGSPITKLAPASAPEDRPVLAEPSRVSPPSKARRSTPEEALSPPLPTTLPAEAQKRPGPSEAPKPSRVIAPSEALNRARRASADRRTKLAAAPVPADGAALEVMAEDGVSADAIAETLLARKLFAANRACSHRTPVLAEFNLNLALTPTLTPTPTLT